MKNENINKVDNKLDKSTKEMTARRIYAYSLHHEGQTYEQISIKLKVSRKTILRDIKWCRKNLHEIENKEPKELMEPIKDHLFKRNILIYMKYCEGRRYDELAETFNLSKKVICKSVKWFRDNIPKDFYNKSLDDVIFDTVRRRAIVWSKFNELSKQNKSANQLTIASKHILDLDNKILEWCGVIKNTMKDTNYTDTSDLNFLLESLDVHLKDKTDEELKDIIKNCSIDNDT